MSAAIDLPFSSEYAKSGRASCKMCKDNIPKDSLRMAVMVQSPFFDGKTPNWHHFECFFKRYRPKGLEEIANVEHLRFDDQKKIEKSIEESKNTITVPVSKKGSKSGKKRKIDSSNEISLDFSVEYAKSNRSECKLCQSKIEKATIRIGKLDRESEDALKFGPLNRWFHVDCFVSCREKLGFFLAASSLGNFQSLEKKDQSMLNKKLPQIDSVKDEKQPKLENDIKENSNSRKHEKSLKKQSQLLFKFNDNLKKLRKSEIMEIFNHNKIQTIPDGTSERIDFLSDALAFGLPEKCPECSGSLLFKIAKYHCNGNVSEWSKCSYSTENPKRKQVKIPASLMEYSFLKKYKFKSGTRLFNIKLKTNFEKKLNEQVCSNLVKKEEDNEQVCQQLSNKPLSGYNISVFGLKTCKSKIVEFGGKYSKELNRTVLCVVTSEEYFKKYQTKKFQTAQEFLVPVVSEKFLNLLETYDTEISQALLQSQITLWNQAEEDINKRITNLNIDNKIESFKSGYKSGSSKSESTKQKIVLKGGLAVDPQSELENSAHIFQENGNIYNAVLNYVDLSKNKNSYYKIQLLEDDRLNGNYWIFKSWGRIATTIGNTKLDKFKSKQTAIEQFKATYYERTLNHWDERKNFQKKPNSYYPVDVDYGDYDCKIDITESKSTLPKQVKDLIVLLFDVQRMRQTLLEFELDLDKMPLGKLSKTQLLEACSTLKEISSLLSSGSYKTSQLTAACNKFYSLVPHNFGTSRIPLITSQEVVAVKNEMLESLMKIELAYEIIQDTNMDQDEDPIDFHYKKLNSSIEPILETEEEYKIIQKYIRNTHASTHNMYQLELVDLFKVTRNDEEKRFKKYANEPNRLLLWHGSRLTNYVGILSQGLRIAPPEAPSTGYMFGKGVYFADSVSKSANYCNSSPESNTGLLVLSEVAIGKSLELKQADYIKKLDKQYLSVKGVGETQPDPKKFHTMPDGVKVPFGKMVKNSNVKDTSLLYNEYIVYNENQIKVRYLVKVKFNYNSLF